MSVLSQCIECCKFSHQKFCEECYRRLEEKLKTYENLCAIHPGGDCLQCKSFANGHRDEVTRLEQKLKTLIYGLPHVVEGRNLAVPSDAEYVKWEPVAMFKYKLDAESYIKLQGEINGECGLVDQLQVRMKEES